MLFRYRRKNHEKIWCPIPRSIRNCVYSFINNTGKEILPGYCKKEIQIKLKKYGYQQNAKILLLCSDDIYHIVFGSRCHYVFLFATTEEHCAPIKISQHLTVVEIYSWDICTMPSPTMMIRYGKPWTLLPRREHMMTMWTSGYIPGWLPKGHSNYSVMPGIA